MTSVARAERNALCDLALELGPGAPTLCGEWNVRDLVAHLVVREKMLAAPGIVVPALKGVTDRAIARTARGSFPDLVAQVRHPRSPMALPVVDSAVNTLEYFVHHEDIRRAQPAWEPRYLLPPVEDTLWRLARLAGVGLVRPAGVPVVLRRTDNGEDARLRRGAGAVEIAGKPSELVMFLYGRRQLGPIDFDGPDDAVRRLRDANLGF